MAAMKAVRDAWLAVKREPLVAIASTLAGAGLAGAFFMPLLAEKEQELLKAKQRTGPDRAPREGDANSKGAERPVDWKCVVNRNTTKNECLMGEVFEGGEGLRGAKGRGAIKGLIPTGLASSVANVEERSRNDARYHESLSHVCCLVGVA
jgi:hypothetical protein